MIFACTRRVGGASWTLSTRVDRPKTPGNRQLSRQAAPLGEITDVSNRRGAGPQRTNDVSTVNHEGSKNPTGIYPFATDKCDRHAKSGDDDPDEGQVKEDIAKGLFIAHGAILGQGCRRGESHLWYSGGYREIQAAIGTRSST
jgi:hypothetical protein